MTAGQSLAAWSLRESSARDDCSSFMAFCRPHGIPQGGRSDEGKQASDEEAFLGGRKLSFRCLIIRSHRYHCCT